MGFVSINVELLGQGLTGSKGGFDAIMKALNGNNVQELKELLDIGFAGFLVLVACCLFAFKLTGQASDLAGTMAGGGGPKIGANIGGLAYGAATKGVQGTLKTGLGAAKAVSDKTGLTNVVNKGRDWAKDKVWGAVGLGRRSGAAGNKQARRSQMGDQQQQQQSSTDGQTPQTQTRPATPGAPIRLLEANQEDAAGRTAVAATGNTFAANADESVNPARRCRSRRNAARKSGGCAADSDAATDARANETAAGKRL
ncbi:MAG: hypothetical protein ACLUQJ_01820 [Alphaproteobacteria bacterium]